MAARITRNFTPETWIALKPGTTKAASKTKRGA